MGSPAVCSFSFLPMEDCTPIVIAYVLKKPWHDLIFRPFDAYVLATPFITATYREDDYLEIETDEATKLSEAMAALGINDFEPESLQTAYGPGDEQAPCYFPYMIREDVWRFMDGLTFTNWGNLQAGRINLAARLDHHKAEAKRYCDAVMQKIAREMAAHSQWKALVPDTKQTPFDITMTFEMGDLERLFQMSEGQRSPMVENAFKSFKERPPTSAEGLYRTIEPLFDVAKLYWALDGTRRSVFPSKFGGAQNFDHYNQVALAEFVRDIALNEGKESDESLGY